MNKNIIIIGAAGTLGYKLCGDLLQRDNYKITAIDIDENSLSYLYRSYNIPIFIEDIRDFAKLKGIIEHSNVDVVVNCAALKHVKWCEENMRRAIEINILSNLELMSYLKKHDKKFVYISSDKAIKPTNTYALTKQFTDYIVNYFNFKLVRGVNFLNSKGSVLDLWDKQYRSNLPFTLIDSKKCNRYFIEIDSMVKLVINAIEEDDNEKIEYLPQQVYKIFIHNLFYGYLKVHNIEKYNIKYFSLPNGEKISEDLNFNPDIIEINNINDISNLIKRNVQ